LFDLANRIAGFDTLVIRLGGDSRWKREDFTNLFGHAQAISLHENLSVWELDFRKTSNPGNFDSRGLGVRVGHNKTKKERPLAGRSRIRIWMSELEHYFFGEVFAGDFAAPGATFS